MAEPETQTSAEKFPWGPLASTGFAKLELVVGAVFWVLIVDHLKDDPDMVYALERNMMFVLPPLAWVLVLVPLLAYEDEWLDALFILLLYPFTFLINLLLACGASLLVEGSVPAGGAVANMITVLLFLIWGALGWLRYRFIANTRTQLPSGRPSKHLQKVLGLAEMMLVVLLIALLGLNVFMPPGRDYSIRNRVAELVLSASSAKTALSEGIQTYGSWSPVWISTITISPGPMVASATIGPTGQIIVYGRELASNSTVTMTPAITTDNKLMWSCTGKPARYMPASCR